LPLAAVKERKPLQSQPKTPAIRASQSNCLAWRKRRHYSLQKPLAVTPAAVRQALFNCPKLDHLGKQCAYPETAIGRSQPQCLSSKTLAVSQQPNLAGKVYTSAT
jgi:hypothetical protein